MTNASPSRWPPIFHLLVLRVGVGFAANFSVFSIPNANCGVGGSKPTQGPNANGFASQWNIGLKGPNTQHSGHEGQIFRTELMVEICSKSLFRAIGIVLLMKFSQNTNSNP